MTPDRPLRDNPLSDASRVRLQLAVGTLAWRPSCGDALVRYAPSGSPATAVLLLSGAFDAETVSCLREALDTVRTPQIELVLLDMTGVTFGDSALVHELTDTQGRPQRHVLLGPLTRQVARLLDLTDTRHALDIALDAA
ncbi:STAS domain-containing protein [Streptomyces omiyaensis]|uniref:STAS domain-containing protein n=1 Tax=Streptomyces omiyaensis TaxID=68247 RepID=A0ABW7C4I0_9ACTN|nr:STAS domain-containing protein [Streptomyces omiyaensis]GGY80494.1 hypothetical protein GCM10010363_71730 [Streptomyces omiyaensis]